jgi:Holliday junction resolvase RusA-like endonuclease
MREARLRIRIPALAPSLNGSKGLMRMHHRTYSKVRDAWTWDAKAAVSTCDAPLPVPPCRVEIVRHYASHPLDLDNLYAACKVPLDALRKAGVLRDDDPDCVTDLRCRQRKVAARKDQQTIIDLYWK